jgi:hypothetical protein
MVAYSFQKRFAEPILDGSKLQTIRPDRRRHARPGEELQLYVGMRTKQCRLVARKTCAAVLPIVLNFTSDLTPQGGFAFVGEGYPFLAHGGAQEASVIGLLGLDGLRFVAAHCETLARNDGFTGWQAMKAFWIERHGAPAHPDEVFVGKLIGWWSL